MLRNDGLVKVLDFGLAKLSTARAGSQSPAADSVNTQSGVVMGTVSYMSPEQARGEKVDHRTDIFSLGVMLYEMLAGRRPFEGATASDVVAAILTGEPVSLAEASPEVPATLWRIVQRCLEKKPGQRFQSAGDLGFALVALSTSPGSRPKSHLDTPAATAVTENVNRSPARKREWPAWLAAALLLGMMGFALGYFTRRPAMDASVFRTSILPPEKSSFEYIAVSPDGRYLAFTASTGGNVQLWVRALNSTEARLIAGTHGARLPFWSPDSRFIGFFADARLKKVELPGGPVQTLGEASAPLGGAWSRNGVILFAPNQAAGLRLISETGGEVIQVTTRDPSRQEITHSRPAFLPDGRYFLYTITSGNKETRGVYLGSLDITVKPRRLLDQVTPVEYVAGAPGLIAGGAGWLVFGRDGELLARPFDTNRLDFTGEPILLSNKVGSDLIIDANFNFSVSDNGVLVFDPSLNRRLRQYRWVDRRGQTLNTLNVPTGRYSTLLSPDEKRFISDRLDPPNSTLDLWLYDISGRSAERFTINPAVDFYPVWSPNGDQIVWSSNRGGVILDLYQRAADFSGEETLLLKSDYPKYPTDWSQDGRFIIYNEPGRGSNSDVWVLPMTGSSKGKPFSEVLTEASEGGGMLSPDGRWLAYTSDESGHFEVYVQRFPGGRGKRQVSTGGGFGPRWRWDGGELFYYSEDGNLMAAAVRSRENFKTDAFVPLFEFRSGVASTSAGATPYAVTRDGQRFLINEIVDKEPNAPLTVVVNWAADSKK